MNTKPSFFVTGLLLLLFSSCGFSDTHRKDQDGQPKTGTPGTELEKVIAEYKKDPADSLQLKAALFLIDNLDGWSYYEGGLLDQYQDYLKLIRKDENHGEYFLNAFTILYGPFSPERLTLKYDKNEINAEELKGNIEMAFKVWREQPWGKDISFNQFLEYILPFRIENERPDYHRNDIYREFNQSLDSVRKTNGNVVSAAIAVNEELKKTPWIFSLRTSFLPHYQASKIIKYRVGSCREMTDLAFYVMRAEGIPVAIDFIPQWPYRSMGHEFNVLLDKNGRSIMFLGSEDDPGTPHKPLTKKGKVYRHIYCRNPNSLGAIKSPDDIVPPFLADPRIKDVTAEYVTCFNIDISLCDYGGADTLLKKRAPLQKKYAYISVFNNENWSPVDWAVPGNNHARFTNIEGDIVYMAGYYDSSGIIPATSPFILTKEGRTKLLQPDPEHPSKLQMTLSAIFPDIPDDFDNWHMKGCRFQGANKADFSDATDLYILPQKPNPFWNEIFPDSKKSFRYVRYFGREYTHMGEMEFYSLGKKCKGRPIGTGTGWYKDKTFDKAMDNDIHTCFDPAGVNPDSAGVWTGMMLERKTIIDRIRFSPPLHQEASTRVTIGHVYELFYWNDAKWISSGRQAGDTNTVTFDNVPSPALYILRDITQPADQRIFTYDKGKVTWW